MSRRIYCGAEGDGQVVRGGGRGLAVAVLDGHFPVCAPRKRTVFRQVWSCEGTTPGTESGMDATVQACGSEHVHHRVTLRAAC